MRTEWVVEKGEPRIDNDCILIPPGWDDINVMFGDKMIVMVIERGPESIYNKNNAYTFKSWRFFVEDTETDWDCLLPEAQLDIVKKLIEAVTPIFPDDVVPWTEEQYALVALENL